MNRSIRHTTFGLALALGTLGAGAAGVGATDGGFASPTTAPPPPRVGTLVAGSPEKSTTCEGNVQCQWLKGACELVGGTYSGWHSKDEGHDHAHGVCTWPWE